MKETKNRRLYGSWGCIAVFVSVSVAGLIIDQLTKAVALKYLSDGRRIPVLDGAIFLQLYRNSGASLGFASAATSAIAILALLACAALVVAAIRTDSPWWSLALGLAFAGADGNLIDRLIYSTGFMNGKVVDFIDYGWSIGNVADVFLTLAALVFVILIVSGHPLRTPPAESARHE